MPTYQQLLASAQFHSAQTPTLAHFRGALMALRDEIATQIIGQDSMIRRGLQAAVLNKHMLIEGVPGEGKTTFVKLLAARSGLNFRRIQFRPDMLPSDLVGARLLTIDNGVSQLNFRPGPLYA